MATRGFDVIVLGVGAMGAATCRALARRGARVLGLEQHAIPNRLGSSHGGSRVFRLAYYEHHDYVPLLLEAQRLWRELEAETGRTLLTTTGGVWMGPRGCPLVHGTAAAAKAHGLAHTLYEPADLAARMPAFRLPEDCIGVEEPDAGILDPEGSISALAGRALAAGAELRAHERVLRWEADARAVRVRTANDVFAADQLVITAGAWSGPLLRDLGVALRVTRQPLCWVAPRTPALFTLGNMPLWAVDHPQAGLQYGFPILPARPGVKIAHHAPGDAADPDTLERRPLPTDTNGMRILLESTLPDADGPLLAVEVCMYTNSPDKHFIIDRHSGHERVSVACGFSGHGFKFTPVIGEILADLALDGATRRPAQFLSLARFRSESHSTSA